MIKRNLQQDYSLSKYFMKKMLRQRIYSHIFEHLLFRKVNYFYIRITKPLFISLMSLTKIIKSLLNHMIFK
ncbi:hypothetical protein ApiMCR53_17090 [Acinetobacter pittii]|nr:hypothetical protein ApiMCR53_17090 [Acinetobacter pittii]